MDMIKKIEHLQNLSLPFGYIYKDSLYIENVYEFNINREFFENSSFDLSYLNIKPVYSFKFSFYNNECNKFNSNKENIILKIGEAYFLLKNISSLLFNTSNSTSNDLMFTSSSNEEYIYNANMIVATGYVEEVIKTSINSY